jgi:hypothetical protein
VFISKNEKCYMYLNFYKGSLTKIMWSLFIGTPNISFYLLFLSSPMNKLYISYLHVAFHATN